MLPSPTAAATRFTGLERTSPHAKMPGTLDSSRYGSRSSPVHGAGSPDIRAGEHVAVRVESDLGRHPPGLGVGADEDEEPAGLESGRLSGLRARDVDLLEGFGAVSGDNLAVEQGTDRRARGDLIDQVLRHALFEPITATDDRDTACVARKVHRCLAGGVSGADDVDIDAVRVRGLGGGGAVVDALPAEPLEAADAEPAPRDTGCEDDRASVDDASAVEVNVAVRRVDPLDRPRYEDLSAEPPRLLESPARELVAGDTGREAEVVLDAGRRPGLAAGRLALDDERAEPLRGAVHGGSKPCRSRTDDHGVVFGLGRLGGEPEQVGDVPKLGPNYRRAGHALDRRPILLRGKWAVPVGHELGLVGRDPLERDLIAIEEVPELGARRIPALPDHHRARRRRCGGEPGQASGPSDPVSGKLANLDRHARSGGGDGVVVVGREPHHARRLGSTKPDGKDGSQRYRHLAEYVARLPDPDHGLDPVRGLDRLDSSFEQPEQGALAAFVRRVLARNQDDVGNGAREPLALRFTELREDRDPSDLFRSDHGRKPTVGLDALSCRTGRR